LMFEARRDTSVTFGDSSPSRGAVSGKPPLKGEVARSAGGVLHRKALFTINDVRKRGLVWDGHSMPYNPALVANARNLRKDMTKAEKKLWYDFLKAHEMKFYRQRPIDHFIADFYCSERSLIIELDGSQHYTIGGLKRDAVRTDILALYGLEIIRFTNNDVSERFDAVCRAINEKLRSLSL
jgi:very-short-patch-repair endonuclease